jgi:hypothetical protein
MRPIMARQFKPVRFFVMMAVAAFVVCGVTAFYAHRAAHGRTAEERAAYAIGERAGEQAPRDTKLPTAAELNMMAQKHFKQEGTGNQLRNPSRAGELQAWDLAFENGYTDGFKKTHSR